jgi:hypothetical protein
MLHNAITFSDKPAPRIRVGCPAEEHAWRSSAARDGSGRRGARLTNQYRARAVSAMGA